MSQQIRRIQKLGALIGVGGLMVGLVGCGSTTTSASGAKTITITLPGSGGITSSYNTVFVHDVEQWTKRHPGVKVQYRILPGNGNIAQANATLITTAAAHDAPDIFWEQYGQADSGILPKGILMNLKPYLDRPNPYMKGNTQWLNAWQSSAIPYMQAANGNMYILVGSDVFTSMVYNKKDFARAGITSTPRTWAQFVADMAKLKRVGVTPLMFTDATGGDNASWFERKFSTELLHYALNKIDVNHAKSATGLDTAVGIERGIISMNNPAYAAGWKLLGSLRPYLAPGASEYSASSSSFTSTPLSPLSPFVKNKFAMMWVGSWSLPELNTLGFAGQYGIFPFPTITKQSAPSSSDINVQGVVGGPNGVGEYSVTTQQADGNMTPATTKLAINLLQYLYSPQIEGGWIADAGNNSYIPLIKGSKLNSATKILSKLLPSKTPPVTLDGIMDGSLTSAAPHDGIRLIQAYLSGSMSWTQFASQWNAVLKSAAASWAQTNNVNLAKYK